MIEIYWINTNNWILCKTWKLENYIINNVFIRTLMLFSIIIVFFYLNQNSWNESIINTILYILKFFILIPWMILTIIWIYLIYKWKTNVSTYWWKWILKWRINRLWYWFFKSIYFLIICIVSLIFNYLKNYWFSIFILEILSIISFIIISLYINIVITVKRIHDFGFNWLWWLILLIPWLWFLWTIAFGIIEWDNKENKYWIPPNIE